MRIRGNVIQLSGLFIFDLHSRRFFVSQQLVSQLFFVGFHSSPSLMAAAATASLCRIPQLAFSSLTATVTSVDFQNFVLLVS
jgi:hypothetical protein